MILELKYTILVQNNHVKITRFFFILDFTKYLQIVTYKNSNINLKRHSDW